jgi:glycosyltransferase involved in cell wall biosynthesis
MATFHILTQYIWPDGAPTGLYAEDVATCLHEQGRDVRLVGGQGNYRPLGRAKPPVPILHLEHYQGRRGNLGQTFVEYSSVKRAFTRYIESVVRSGDVVIVTSAPPNTVRLADAIKRRGAYAIYWLQDYYPELVRGIHDYPAAMRMIFRAWWDRQLAQWDKVVKIGENLGGKLENAIVIRNWPTISFDGNSEPEPKTALYLGNLGYGHDVDLLVKACQQLRDRGYKTEMHADGPGVRRLPEWLNAKPALKDVAESRNALLRNEIHLIAADPKITQAIFPSKIWNSLAARRLLVCTGFAGEMATELEAARNARFDSHLGQWTTLLADLASCPERATTKQLEPRVEPELQPAAIA